MARPTPHSCTWSDDDATTNGNFCDHERDGDTPQGLVDKELYFWVTYPDEKGRKVKKKKTRKRGPHQKARKLWAVVIIETLKMEDAFTFDVTLRTVFKRDENIINIWVRNDPGDQSEEAPVFSFLSPVVRELPALEQQLSQLAAKRVYDAIAHTWPDCQRLG